MGDCACAIAKMGIGGECRKFAANVFNKNKCSNCYKLRDQHCDEALETGKLARNISRCGFLFVAPDWDFTNPVYRYAGVTLLLYEVPPGGSFCFSGVKSR